MARIAVEPSLSNVKQALQQNGYDVVDMQADSMQSCDCCVISGQDKNMMGMGDVQTQASVINAEGMSAEDVVQQVQQRIQS
ncbi:YkuS family protein [Marinicrinis lubricantis]|uniref:YkuS family protein n=1 Tax=Marinicrinis lubricantis TaxID=2086470 RepID=A0ABW1IUJ5_9BACL